jgi:hypothetical protein
MILTEAAITSIPYASHFVKFWPYDRHVRFLVRIGTRTIVLFRSFPHVIFDLAIQVVAFDHWQVFLETCNIVTLGFDDLKVQRSRLSSMMEIHEIIFCLNRDRQLLSLNALST